MPDYKITTERNAPTLHIDGEAVPPVMYCLSDIPGSDSNTAQAQKNIKNFAEAGIRLVSADTGIHLGWHKVSPFDSEAMREEIAAVADANPDAKVLLRLHVNPPYWWLRDHPEECVIYRTSEGDVPGIDDGEQDRLIRNDHMRHIRVSLASEVWLREASEKLELFLKSLEGTREGEVLMAVQIACGVNGEWHQWGTDVSAPMKARFVRYLRETYGTVENLRAAWHNPDVTFETAEFRPEPSRPGDDGIFRDPEKSQDTTDSQRTNQLAVAEAILHFCRVVKRVAPQYLAGSFYAYYYGTGGSNMTIGGHLRPDLMYADPAVDFLCGPFCYADNRKSDGVPMQRALQESHRLRGMLWLTEMDQHPVATNMYIGGDITRLDETISVMRRNTFQNLLAGEGFWYYDHRLIPRFLPEDSQNPAAGSIYRKIGWWERPEYMAEIAKIQRLAEKITAKPYVPAADVLLVQDTDSYYYRARVNDEEYKMHSALARNGVAYDSIYLGELPAADLSRYRIVIFQNCQMMTPAVREEARRLTAGCLRIFLNGCGYCDGKTLSEANISAAVGMDMRRTKAQSLSIGDDTLEWVASYAPAFTVSDADAEVLARWDTGDAAAAMRGNDVYFPFPYVPVTLMRTLIERAGAHVWCDSGEPVLAGAGYVAVNCQHAGERTLTLPNGKSVKIVTDGFATPLFDMETGERVM